MAAEQSGPDQAENAKAAYALLSKATHAQLEKRAERSSRIEGHHVEPFEVLAPGLFALKFQPKQFTTSVNGDTATVRLAGDAPEDSATMRCVKEGKVWRVSLDLPELLDLPHRQD